MTFNTSQKHALPRWHCVASAPSHWRHGAQRVRAVERANCDDSLHVIVLAGRARGVCLGYGFTDFAEAAVEQLGGGASVNARDSMVDHCGTKRISQNMMSWWCRLKLKLANGYSCAGVGDSVVALAIESSARVART